MEEPTANGDRPQSSAPTEQTEKEEPTDPKELTLDLNKIDDDTPKDTTKKRSRQKNTSAKKPPNPYQNTEIAAIKLLRRRQKVSNKKTRLPHLIQEDGQEDALPPTSPRGNGPTSADVTLRTDYGEGTQGNMTGRTSFPSVTKQRYSSASLRSLYMREEEKNRRSKGSAGTRKSNSLVWEVGGGSLMTYTGVQRMRKESLEQSTKRLAISDNDKVPDAARILPPDVTNKCGLTASFQWTAGGARCHGFIW